MLRLFLIIWFLEFTRGMILIFCDRDKEDITGIKILSHIIGSALDSAFNAAIIGYFMDMW